MTQMWLLWWPKNVSAAATTTTTTASASGKTSTSSATGAVTATSLARKASSSHCNCVAKLLRKLKKRGRVLCSTSGESSAFQCRYDPLSYSLNFDTSGCGSLIDEDYYQFCAFSSRFASNPGNASHPFPDVTIVTSSR